MLQGIRQRAVVGGDGTLVITSPELLAGTEVEVIVLIDPDRQDTTDYLMDDPANRNHLLRSLRDLEDRDKYIFVDTDTL